MGDVVAVGRGGLRVGRQGFGGAPLGGLFAPVDGRDAAATLEEAWAQGIRYFDTAPHYGAGLSERRVGEFLAGKPLRRVGVVDEGRTGARVGPTR